MTTADVLEALHRATGRPIVADFYTRLYPQGAVTVRDQPLFEALNRLGDAMGLRWHKEGDWLQFRSACFYYDRLREVPNRLLARWTAVRRQHGVLPPDDLVEIAQLADAPLDSAEMAEGAKECWGLKEWDLARSKHLRAHLRFLAHLTPEQRREAMLPAGLAFTRISLPQQQGFLALTLGARATELKVDLHDLASATLHVDYKVPGGLQWLAPEQPGLPPQLVPRPALPESHRQGALENARRFNDQRPEEELLARLQPEWDLEFTYTIGRSKEREIRRRANTNGVGLHTP